MLLLSIILLITIIYIFFILPTQWLKVERIKHDISLNKKILQISDLHMERLRIKPHMIKKVIEKEKPDYLFLTGDFLDKQYSLEKLESYLNVFELSGKPTFAVLGNHDYYLENLNDLTDLLEKYKIKTLRNESVLLDDFNLIGIDDFCSGHSNIEKSFIRINENKKRVVITHDPNIVLELNRKYDYLMSGHLHGKQVNIPFLFKLKPMGTLPSKGTWKGLNKTKHGTYYISKGLGQSNYNIRFLVRSEVTIHEL